MAFHPNSLPDLKGKVYIVTGGNGGIGYHTVAHLAAHGAHVYLCSRSASKGEAAVSRILQQTPNAHITLLLMDLTSLASVVAGAQRFLSLETALHGLVNNAGIMATPFMLTGDGHEAQWQTNYLAHWVLTAHLLPTLQRTAKAEGPGSVRVVNVSSSGHLAAPKGGICFARPELKDEAGGSVWKRYGQSKLANILHARTLHAQYGPGSPGARDGEGEIWTSAVHPGIVESGLAGSAEQNTTGFSGVLWAMRKMGVTMEADKGAWTNLWCVAGKEMTAERSGGYEEVFNRCGEPGWMSGPAKDAKLAERLEEWTEEIMTREGWVGKK